LISPADYERIVAENEELMVHPDYMTPNNAHRNMHWRLEEERLTMPMEQGAGELMNSSRRSVYHDANTGLDQDEE